MLLPNKKEEASTNKIGYIRREYKLDDKLKNKYSGKTYFLKTYGCQMNERDSEAISGILEEMGLTRIDDYRKADVLLLNTCSIRENAHNKAFGMLGRFKHLKEERPDIVVCVCGCMSQEKGVIDEILKNYRFVNLVIGTHNLDRVGTLLDEAITNNKQEIEVYSREQDFVEDVPSIRSNPYKAYVNIIYGCDKFCTYCIVPYTRGR